MMQSEATYDKSTDKANDSGLAFPNMVATSNPIFDRQTSVGHWGCAEDGRGPESHAVGRWKAEPIRS